MIDLSSIGQMLRTKSAQAVPAVAGIVVAKSEGKQLDAIKKALTDNGFKVDEMKDLGEDAVMFTQLPDPEKDSHVVRLSDTTVVVLKDFSPFEAKLAANVDFEPALKQDGFYQGVATATQAYSKAMSALLQKGDAVTDVAKVTEKFNAYVATLTAGIPASAFKMDAGVSAAIAANPVKKAAMVKPDAMDQDKWDGMSADDQAIACSTADNTDPDGDGDNDYAKKSDDWKLKHKDAITAEPSRDGSSPNAKVGTKPEGISDDMWNSILKVATAAVMTVTGGTQKTEVEKAAELKAKTEADAAAAAAAAAAAKKKAEGEPMAQLLETVANLALAVGGLSTKVEASTKKSEALELKLKGTVAADLTNGDPTQTQAGGWGAEGQEEWITDTAIQKKQKSYNAAKH